MSLRFQAIKQNTYIINNQVACCETMKLVLKDHKDNTIILSGSLQNPSLEMKIDKFGVGGSNTWLQIHFCPFCGVRIECLITYDPEVAKFPHV